MKKITIFIVLVVCFAWCKSQNVNLEKDSVFKNTIQKLYVEGKFKQSLDECKTLIKKYENAGNKAELAKLYVYTANVCVNIFRIEESLYYLDLTSELIDDINDPFTEGKMYAEYGRNYKLLGFKEKALDYYAKSLELTKKSNHFSKNKRLQYAYTLFAMIYEEDGDYKKLYQQLTKAHHSVPDVYTSARLAQYYTSFHKNLDSAKYYLNLGENLYQTGEFPLYQNSMLKRSFGLYHFQEKYYEKAIANYEESVSISIQLSRPQDTKDTYFLLQQAYKANNEERKYAETLQKYTKINDSLALVSKNLREIPIKKIIQEKETEEKKSRNWLYFVIACITILFLIILFLIQRKNASQNKIKETLIEDKENENKELLEKSNDYFEEITKLAKSGSPEFFARFQEIYPNFVSEVLKIQPKLRASELTLCAYIYLGFKTKDIAEYTSTSIYTVKSRKTNLRKKLDVPARENFDVWMRNLGKKI